ncbi:hypothetical protein ACWDFR_23785 [Streptomyces sp. 900105755]
MTIRQASAAPAADAFRGFGAEDTGLRAESLRQESGLLGRAAAV